MNLVRTPDAVDDGVVCIRRPHMADAPALLAAVAASRPELEAWMPWCGPDYGLEDAQAWLLLATGNWPEGPLCPFVIESCADRELLGACGVDVVDALDHAHKLGYWVRSDRTGAGIARRAGRLLAAYAFEHLDAQRIDILVATDNVRSQAVARALGAVEEGTLRSRFLLQGRRHDALIFGLLPGDLAAT
ncbi:MAG TPA: GNAT family protein [Pseudomonadales bacterium]|nr:GNAT family protein [Pseudomonadales bacterium]